MGTLFRQTPNNGYPFPPKWPLKMGTGLEASASHPRPNNIWVPPPPPPGLVPARMLHNKSIIFFFLYRFSTRCNSFQSFSITFQARHRIGRVFFLSQWCRCHALAYACDRQGISSSVYACITHDIFKGGVCPPWKSCPKKSTFFI